MQTRLMSLFCAAGLVLASCTQTARQSQARAEPMVQLRTSLGALRSLMTLYQYQHDGRLPAMANMTDWHSLLESTYDDGHFGPNGAIGASLKQAPVNPLNGASRVVAAGAPVASAGWTYNESTGALRAIVPAADVARAGQVLLPGDYEIAR